MLYFLYKLNIESVGHIRTKGVKMKKIMLVGLLAMFAVSPVMADGVYTETETVTTWERVSACPKAIRYNTVRDVKPCARKQAAKPVRIKTHTEVINHYQVYQPVTVYRPMGTQIERQIVPAKTCNKCAM